MLFFGKSFIIWNTRWGTLLTDSYQGSTSTGEKSTWILRCCPIPEHMIYIAETWWTKTNGCREQDFMWSSKGRDSDPISPSASLANSLSVFIRCLTFIVALINIIYLIFTIANEPTVTYKGLKLKLNWSKLALSEYLVKTWYELPQKIGQRGNPGSSLLRAPPMSVWVIFLATWMLPKSFVSEFYTTTSV